MSQNYRLIRHKVVDSTQLELKNLLERNPQTTDIVAVSAQTQRHGKGRGVSVWQDEPGYSALFSVFIRWPKPVQESFLVNKWVCHVLATVMPPTVQYKWPNDLMVGTKKLGGLLIENRWEGRGIGSSIIGCGLNVLKSSNQLERAITLEEMGISITVEETIESILEAMRASVVWIQNEALMERRYADLLWGRDTFQRYIRREDQHPFLAKVRGVNNQGKLVLETQQGERFLYDLDEIRWDSSDS